MVTEEEIEELKKKFPDLTYFKPKIKLERITKERKKLFRLIGDKCQICDSIKNLRFHEIHGKRHEMKYKYIIKHLKDFVPLCQRCHSTLHFTKRAEKLNLIQKKRLVRLLSML